VAVAAAIVMLLAGLLFGPTASAAPGVVTPAAVALTVTPSTLLLNKQFVTVAGTGYPAGTQVGIIQCRTTPGGVAGCDQSTLSFVTTGPDGGFSVGKQVKRLINVDTGTLDCSADGACIMGAGVPPDGAIAANTPIRFDPNVPPPPPPQLTVDPSVGLLNNQIVTVTGSDYEPDSGVGIVQCRAPSNGPEDCDLAIVQFVAPDASGDFSAPFQVRRLIQVEGVSIDCAVAGACEIGAGSGLGPGQGAQAAIQFDPNQPLPPPPSITVTPSTGLVDGQQVAVNGTGFPPFGTIAVLQCQVGDSENGENCDIAGANYPVPDEFGDVFTPFVVKQTMPTAQGNVDCAVTPCALVAATLPSGALSAAVTLVFRSASPPTSPDTTTPLVTPRFAG